jgi:hypothetical protein
MFFLLLLGVLALYTIGCAKLARKTKPTPCAALHVQLICLYFSDASDTFCKPKHFEGGDCSHISIAPSKARDRVIDRSGGGSVVKIHRCPATVKVR